MVTSRAPDFIEPVIVELLLVDGAYGPRSGHSGGARMLAAALGAPLAALACGLAAHHATACDAHHAIVREASTVRAIARLLRAPASRGRLVASRPIAVTPSVPGAPHRRTP